MSPLYAVDPGLLALFSLAALTASVGAVFLSGFFPARERPQGARSALGAALLWLGLGLSAALAAAAIGLAAAHLPPAVAIVAAGLAVLAAPFLVQPVPERLRDSVAGLGLFAALAGGVLVAQPLGSLL